MKHKYEEELEILKERICRDVRESIKHFLESDPEQGMHYEAPLEKQFAEVCEDIADRVSNMADNFHYNTFNTKKPWVVFLYTGRGWLDTERFDTKKEAIAYQEEWFEEHPFINKNHFKILEETK